MKLARGFNRLTFFLATCLAGAHVIAKEGTAGPATLPELQSAIAAVVEERAVPAVGIAMVDASGPVRVGAIGKANLETRINADENRLFRIGSTSEMFVVLPVLKQVEEGGLSPDDRPACLGVSSSFLAGRCGCPGQLTIRRQIWT